MERTINLQELWKAKFFKALQEEDSEGHLVRAVIDFKNSGGSQKQAENILVQVWEENYDPFDTPEKIRKAWDNVIDAVTGRCCLHNHIFSGDFEEENYYRPIPKAQNL